MRKGVFTIRHVECEPIILAADGEDRVLSIERLMILLKRDEKTAEKRDERVSASSHVNL